MLKESKQETTVVLIGDSDMIQDRVAVRQVGNPFGQRLFMPANGNLAFAENLIDQLTGDSNLIAVRSRASRERPFTVVKKMQADAEASYRSKIKELEESLADAQRKIGQLQSGKQEGQRFILSPQQQEELANFRKKEAEAKTQLKEVRKKLRADIDSLENRIKWLNIAGMPALVAAHRSGIRHRQTPTLRCPMNSRQLTLIVVFAVVLAAIGWILFHRGARSWESQPTSRDGKVIEFPLNDVAHITIKDGTSELNLVRKEDGWVVRERADYPANFEQVSRLLQKIWNLKPVQTLQVGPSQLGRFDLVEPANGAKSGTLLELKDKDEKRIAALLVGKQYFKKSNQNFGPAGFPAGRYVMPEDGSKRVALVSDPLQDLVTKPERWLNRPRPSRSPTPTAWPLRWAPPRSTASTANGKSRSASRRTCRSKSGSR